MTTISTLPVFLIGSLATEISHDVPMSSSGVGGLVAAFLLAGAVASTPAGRVVERFGPRAGLTGVAIGSFMSGFGISVAGDSKLSMAAWLVVGGVSTAISQPTANILLARRVDARRQGLAFGVKQAAVPLASMLAGLAVLPATRWTGWRTLFLLASLTALTLLTQVRHLSRDRPVGPSPQIRDASGRPGTPLIILTLAAGLAGAGGTSLPTFLVPAGVDRGIDPQTAGIVLAFGSAVAIGMRMVLGWRADRRGRGNLITVFRLLMAGAVGLLGLAFMQSAPLYVLGATVGFGAGWSWNGLFQHAVVKSHASSPAAASGVVFTGLFVGSGLGPLCIGFVADHRSFGAAWLLAAAMLAAGGILMALGRKRLSLAARPRT